MNCIRVKTANIKLKIIITNEEPDLKDLETFKVTKLKKIRESLNRRFEKGKMGLWSRVMMK